jgi:hypothetical protein
VLFYVQGEAEEKVDHQEYNTEYIFCNIQAEAEETIDHMTQNIFRLTLSI